MQNIGRRKVISINMNVIFCAVFIAAAVLAAADPEVFLPALIDGAEQAAAACVSLFCIYALWMGLSRVAQDAGINDCAARALRPACFKIFATRNKQAAAAAAANLTCNMLGLGGAATPYGIAAMRAFERENNDFACGLLFVLNASSVQLIPSTVIALRASCGSAAAADIFLPALICTAACTFTAVAIYLAMYRLCHLSSRRCS